MARATLHQLSSKWQVHMEIFFMIMVFMQLQLNVTHLNAYNL